MEQALQRILQEKFQKDIKDATKEEIYTALLFVTKEKMEGMTPNTGDRKLYYISAEFLIGKLLSNNLINLGLFEETREVLAKYGNANSGVSITITTDTINHLYDMLSNYELDLAIVEGRLQAPGISALLLDTDSLVCAISNNNPLARRSMVTLSDLRREKMILRSQGSATRDLFVSHLESLNLSLTDFNVVLEVDNIATIKDLIRKDLGVSILARSACMDEWRKGKLTLLPIENLSMIREISILYHQDFHHPEVLQELTKIYHQTAGGGPSQI